MVKDLPLNMQDKAYLPFVNQDVKMQNLKFSKEQHNLGSSSQKSSSISENHDSDDVDAPRNLDVLNKAR